MRLKLFYCIIAVQTLYACNQHQESEMLKDHLSAADSTSFSSDISSLSSPSRKWLRSADIRCRVPDVFAATYRLEQLVGLLGGVVNNSNIRNEAIHVNDFNYKFDSLKKVQVYTPAAYLTFKVPVAFLDSIVHSLSMMSDFTDCRTLKQQDVTLQYLSNALKNKAVSGVKLPADSKHQKAWERIKYEEERNGKVINRRVENLSLLDQVEYATLTVQLFQPAKVDELIVVDPAYITKADFRTELVSALRNGTDLLKNIILFFIHIWPLLVAGFIALVIYRTVWQRVVFRK